MAVTRQFMLNWPQMDEALMAKEAEKAELMKQRQKLREQLARPELAGAELESLR